MSYELLAVSYELRALREKLGNRGRPNRGRLGTGRGSKLMDHSSRLIAHSS
jgi:hypothetical protein